MKTDEEMEEFDQKCRVAGCSPEKAKLHSKMFRERWDVHPPERFVQWFRQHQPNATNVVSGWNSDPCRQEYYEWVEIGQPDLPPEQFKKPFNMQESMAEFRAAMSKIESRFSRGRRDLIISEDTRNKGYDKRP